MKRYLLYCLAFIITACGSGDGCMGYDGQTLDGRNYGYLKLDTINYHWVPTFNNSVFTFENTTNHQLISFTTLYERYAFKDIIFSHYSNGPSPCKEEIIKNDFCKTEWQKLSYSSINSPFEMKISRFKNYQPFDFVNFDSLKFIHSPDSLLININSKTFPLQLANYSNNGNQQFYSTILLNGTLFDSIFEYHLNINDSNQIVPAGVYYSPSKGIVGFYLTNKIETWIKK